VCVYVCGGMSACTVQCRVCVRVCGCVRRAVYVQRRRWVTWSTHVTSPSSVTSNCPYSKCRCWNAFSFTSRLPPLEARSVDRRRRRGNARAPRRRRPSGVVPPPPPTVGPASSLPPSLPLPRPWSSFGRPPDAALPQRHSDPLLRAGFRQAGFIPDWALLGKKKWGPRRNFLFGK